MIKLYNSLSKTKEILEQDEVRIYVCGPTVYDDAHLGHARSAIVFDLLRRFLRFLGCKVVFAKNFTDIDDKIINRSKNENIEMNILTQKYIDRYISDMVAVGVDRADIEPRATEYISQMVELVELLLNNGFAYTISNQDIYFDTSKAPNYGYFASQNIDDTQNRVISTDEKRNPKDFVLWKADNSIFGYDTKIGRGRPGWHLECSAMIKSSLAYIDREYQIDIHCGGSDLAFPHHENEIAQSEMAYNQKLSKLWLHNGFVNINNQKMSKSLNNSFFLKDALKIFDGEILRFYLMSIHYRANFNFANDDIISSKKRLDRYYRLKKRVENSDITTPDDSFVENIKSAMSDDMNISMALSIIDNMVSVANEEIDKTPKDKILISKIHSNLEVIKDIFGILRYSSTEYFQLGVDDNTKQEITKAIESRLEAKKSKNYQLADEIRSRLLEIGISLMDTANGTVWEKI